MASKGRRHRWLRPLGLLAIVLGLSVGQPFVLIAIPFGLLTFLQPGERVSAMVLGALVLGFALAGHGSGGLWYLERGWAIIVAGWFAALTLARPAQPFLPRALLAVGGGTVWVAALLLVLDGWERVEWMVRERVEASAAATLEFSRAIGAGTDATALGEAVERTAALQVTVFPALVALSTLAALGVAWWLHVRLSGGSDQGLAKLKNLRFADGLIWLFIAGLALVLLMGWTEGWGRVGSNLMLFVGALYALRGAAVLLFLSGGVGWIGVTLIALATVFAAPVIFAGALMVGLGDTWLDLRTAATIARDEDGKQDS
ncbi:MAG: DUF2232 domain-containing protein [Gemmatimonadales bacterium]|nr:MAG: DUF2232 domain-containing protein [Gemmatimonadales bacterium]